MYWKKILFVCFVAAFFTTTGHAQFWADASVRKSSPTRLSVSDLDFESRKCMRCHDGSNGTYIPLRPVTAPIEHVEAGSIKTKNHSVGMFYAKSVEKQPTGYVDPISLNSRIKLIGGKVGCLSCHIKKTDEEGPSRNEQVCTNDSKAAEEIFHGRLCQQCHIK